MKLAAVPAFDIVRLIDLHAPEEGGFCLLIIPASNRDAIDELSEELEVQLGANFTTVEGTGLSLAALLEKLRIAAGRVVIVTGLESWSNAEYEDLDINRSQLSLGKFIIFAVDLESSGRLLNAAPNLRSWMGTSILLASPDPSKMTQEGIDSRIAELSTHYRLSNEDVIEKAQNGTLPPDPHFIEWLVLIGRGDLAG